MSADPVAAALGRWNAEEDRAGIHPVHRSFRFGGDAAGPEAGESVVAEKKPVLLLHGAGGSPADFRDLGHVLAAAGFHGVCPRLPGHGADPAALAQSRFAGLLERAQEAFDVLAAGTPRVGIVAQSLGAVLAVRIVNARSVGGLVALAPALRPYVVRRLGLFLIGIVVQPRLAWATLRWQLDLLGGIRETRGRLAGVQCPLLVLVSRDDPTISPRGARELHDGVSSPDRELVELADQGHVLSAAPDRRVRVFPRILGFLERLSCPAPRNRTTDPPPGAA